MTNEPFKLTIPITRAYKKDGKMMIDGVASSTALDTYDTIFARSCQENFSILINESSESDDPIQLEAEHKGDEEPMNILGPIQSACVTPDDELFIVGRLDEKNPKAVFYYDLLTNPDPKLGRPRMLGLSINGVVEEAHWEYREDLQRNIRVFDKVKLLKVGIVRYPSNPNTYLEKMIRSVDWDAIEKKEIELMSDNIETAVVEETVDVEIRSDEVVSDSTDSTVTETETSEEVERACNCDPEKDCTCNKEEVIEEERAMDTSDVAVQTEDVEETCDEQRSEEVVETVEEEVVREDNIEKMAEIMAKMICELKDELTRSIDELKSKVEIIESEKSELVERVAVLETEKVELVTRMAVMEKTPTTSPGAQLVGNVVRAEKRPAKGSQAEYELLLREAEAKGDKETVKKLMILNLFKTT